MDEVRLLGGNTHAEVVRVGSTVRRPTGHWTPGVHALLRHLHANGYESAPQVLGIDDSGREILTYVSGSVVWPDRFSLVQTDSGLASVAACIRRYHDVVADFTQADQFTWSERGRDPRGPAELVCHNDLAPWNLVHRAEDEWTFIDWDVAAPGRRAWDVSWALLSFAPLMPDSGLTVSETRHRITTFREGYGAAALPTDVLTVAVERCEHEAERIGRLGAAGEHPYARLLAEGHYEIWRSTAAHIDAHIPQWQKAVSP
jgi:hypothetical protein